MAPADANQGSSTGRFSRPPRNGGKARIMTGMPVRAAPHHAAFHGNEGCPKKSPTGPRGTSNCGKYSPHLRYPYENSTYQSGNTNPLNTI